MKCRVTLKSQFIICFTRMVQIVTDKNEKKNLTSKKVTCVAYINLKNLNGSKKKQHMYTDWYTREIFWIMKHNNFGK